MIEKNYDIHDLVRVRLVSRGRSILKGLNFPLSYFETETHFENPEITLNIGDFSPSNQGTYLVDYKYHVNENYIFFEGGIGRTRLKFEIIGFEKGPTKINLDGRIGGLYDIISPDILAHDQILIPMIEMALASKGVFLTHGCGIMEDERAHLFLGRAGALKSTIALYAADKGMSILGDDRVIFDPLNKRAYCFPLFPRLIEYLIDSGRGEKIDTPARIALLHHLRREEPRRRSLWPSGPISLSSLNLVVRKDSSMVKPEKRKIEKKIAIDMMVANNMAEISTSGIPRVANRIFSELMAAYSFTFPDSHIAGYWSGIREMLNKISGEIELFKIEMPVKLNREDFHDIYSKS